MNRVRLKVMKQFSLCSPSIDGPDVEAVPEELRSPSHGMCPKVRESERAIATYAGTPESLAVKDRVLVATDHTVHDWPMMRVIRP